MLLSHLGCKLCCRTPPRAASTSSSCSPRRLSSALCSRLTMERAPSSGKRSRAQVAAAATHSEQTAFMANGSSKAGTSSSPHSSLQQPPLAKHHQQQHGPTAAQTQTLQQMTPPVVGYGAAQVAEMSTTSDSDSDSGPLRVPLKLVVADAVKRWFNETLSEARRGDVKQQALLAQMLAAGYGCKQDVEESKRWAERARVRGYHMSGVYCEL